MPTANRKYGWIPDVPDQRDRVLALPGRRAAAKLPAAVDLRGGFPAAPYDQGELGSCTAQAAAAAVQFDLARQKLTLMMPSRLFVYRTEREIEGTVGVDSGATVRDSCKAMNKGYPDERFWPYVPAKFAKRPTAAAFADAKRHRAVTYQRVTRTLVAMKTCLAGGTPFLMGFSVYDSFESDQVARTGTAPMPADGEELLGGHAVLCCGYSDATNRFTIRNSWGPGWGWKGYFTLPYAYLLDANLSDDFWAVSLVA